MVPPDQLRQQIRAIRALTSRPFGVNLLLHRDLQLPVDPSTIPDNLVGRVHGVLNGFRERLGIRAVASRPPRPPDLIAAALDVLIDDRVPVFSIGLGCPSRELVVDVMRRA